MLNLETSNPSGPFSNSPWKSPVLESKRSWNWKFPVRFYKRSSKVFPRSFVIWPVHFSRKSCFWGPYTFGNLHDQILKTNQKSSRLLANHMGAMIFATRSIEHHFWTIGKLEFIRLVELKRKNMTTTKHNFQQVCLQRIYHRVPTNQISLIERPIRGAQDKEEIKFQMIWNNHWKKWDSQRDKLKKHSKI